jgi:hypothetical protein
MRTSLYSILCIGIRLAAVLLAAYTLAGIPRTFSIVAHGEWGTDTWTLFAVYAVTLLVALLLWIYPGLLARLAAGQSSHQVFESPIEASDLQYIAYSIVGLWLLFDGLGGLIYDGVNEMVLRQFIRSQNGGLDIPQVNDHAIASAVVHVVQLGVGVTLILGARGLVTMLRKARYGGLPPADDGEDGDEKP